MSGQIRTYRDLLVWQKAMGLVTEVYRISRAFPREEVYGLTSQLRRCAVSIPSNIAEGYGRSATKDYIRFLRVAMGSLYELQTQVQIAVNLDYLTSGSSDPVFDLAREIERMMSSLLSKLHDPSSQSAQ